MMHCQNTEVCHNIFVISQITAKNGMHLSSLTHITSHFELPNNAEVSLNNGYAKLFFAIFIFKCLKSVTTLLSEVSSQLINITGLGYTEKPSFNIPK